MARTTLARCGTMRHVASRFDPNPSSLPVDERWPRAGHWLAAGPGERPVDLALVGVPAFTRSLRRSGAYATPTAVRRALHHYTTWCASRHVDLTDIYPWDLGDVEEPDGHDGDWRTSTVLSTALAKARATVVLGGDGTVTTSAALAGGQLRGLGLVMFDAFFDVREGVGSTSSLRRLLDAGLDAARIAHLGSADWLVSRSHVDEMAARGLRVMSRRHIDERGVGASLSQALDIAGTDGRVHVSIDFSVCDRAVAPGSVDAVPGGLSAREISEVAFLAGRDRRVCSLDLVEVDATADAEDQRTVRLVALAVLEFAAGVALRP